MIVARNSTLTLDDRTSDRLAAVERRLAALEIVVQILTDDRHWLVARLAEIAVDLEGNRR